MDKIIVILFLVSPLVLVNCFEDLITNQVEEDVVSEVKLALNTNNTQGNNTDANKTQDSGEDDEIENVTLKTTTVSSNEDAIEVVVKKTSRIDQDSVKTISRGLNVQKSNQITTEDREIRDYRRIFYEYMTALYKQLLTLSTSSSVISLRAIWLTLAAVAEGSDLESQAEIFRFLRLPNDSSIREKYYKLAAKSIIPGDDVFISSRNTLVIDEGLRVNIKWLNLINKNFLIDVVAAPIRRYPEMAAQEISRVLSLQVRNLNLTGNSVLLNTIDYDGLWYTAFSHATIERAPFYNEEGERTGSVDLMRMKKRVRVYETAAVKVMELPIGVDKRYRIIFGFPKESLNIVEVLKNITAEGTFNLIDNLKYTEEPVEVAIPRFTITTEIDMRKILDYFNITRIWNDPVATGYISEPPALPSGYYQRATLTLNSGGLEPSYPDPSPTSDKFIANKPFGFSLFDAETYTCIMSVVFTEPTYKD